MTENPTPLPLHFDASGLVPAVIQDADRDDVLMIGFMNEDALAATRATGRVHFWSRSRNKLWRKGETSGHEQIVETIAVNCEQNSLLIRVHQIGAVCHDGYDTCYYRDLGPDNSLTSTRERIFDPATVYDLDGESSLVALTQSLLAAYALLRDNDVAEQSATSRRLRADDDTVTSRISDEVEELAGVLDGTHSHIDFHEDIRLEASQVIYWVLLACLRRRIGWAELRPDRALSTIDPALQRETLVAMLIVDARTWRQPASDPRGIAARCHATLSLVAQSCLGANVDLHEVLAADLDDLTSKPYIRSLLADVDRARTVYHLGRPRPKGLPYVHDGQFE